jgi:hypothetical protein
MGAEHPIMQENLPVERLVRKALRAEEPIGRPGIRQLGIPQGAKRLEERYGSGAANMRGNQPRISTVSSAGHCLGKNRRAVCRPLQPIVGQFIH